MYLLWHAFDGQYHSRFFFLSSPSSASCPCGTTPLACPSPSPRPRISSQSGASTRTLLACDSAKPHPRPHIGFRREFLPGRARCIAPTIIVFWIHGHSPFRVVCPCRAIAFRRLCLKRHASRNPSLHGHYPLHRYYGSIRLLPPCLRRDRSPKFPCRTFGTRHVPIPRPVGRVAKRLRRVRVGFRYYDPLGHGRPFGWKYRGVHTGLHFRLAHSFVGLGFCASVALRTANLPIGMSFSLPYRFLSLC